MVVVVVARRATWRLPPTSNKVQECSRPSDIRLQSGEGVAAWHSSARISSVSKLGHTKKKDPCVPRGRVGAANDAFHTA
jgi:hypothetical protein